MDRPTEDRIIAAIEAWAFKHPEPEAPVICVAGAGMYTPGQIAEQVRQRTPVGQLLLKIVDNGLKHGKLQEILNGFEGRRSLAAETGQS